ncbi:SpoIIE family protein phosphatase [Streptomyces sp. NBC_01294]|uniref:SpoIIE family protein phosphatase n=1 Tax=Streptomyces sp. NBC_01294 TaxID=2903815 RepID=UPI002DDB4569|nr:SpoIIE family protein phosphatase [Streptomyces sp. NBC_01294]WRZ61055.1 SpoIIE family protein phosphatase [Streptomyces sp. NBC_01294]
MPGTDVFALIDEKGMVVEWGRAAEELFGWSAKEAVGRSVADLVREIAGGGEGRREGTSDGAAVLVKPVLRGESLLWHVQGEGRTPSSWDGTILKALFTRLPVRLHVLDDQLRVVRASTAISTPGDTRTGPLSGKHFTEVYDLEDPEGEAAVARRVLERGEPVVNRLVRGRAAPGSPGRRIHSVSYFRLEDSRGDVLGLVTSEADVTESERTRNRLVLLDAIRTRVGPSLMVDTVCRDVVQASVPAFAGTAVVDVAEALVRGEDAPPVPADQDMPLRQVAFQGPISPHPGGEVRSLPAGTPFSDILTDLRPRVIQIEEDSGSAWLAADPFRADLVKRSGAHSLIVAPLALHGRALGVVSFYRHGPQDRFEDEDIEVASAICAHAALCIDNAARYMREWVVALTVQRRLLPQHPATQDTVDITHLHLPDPEGGGAWFDVIDLPGARTALIVGELTGRGIIAAITTGLLRTAIHTLAALDLQPDELLARLSDTTVRLATAYAARPSVDPRHSEPLTVGCTIAVYDPVDLTFAIARAGLPEPVAILPDGTSAAVPVPLGPLLADTGDAPFPATTVSLPAGSVLALGTAALADEVLASSAPLRPLLNSAGRRPRPDVCADIAEAFTGGEALLLLARTKPLPPERVLTCDLPAEPEAAPIARSAVRRQLDVWGVDEETAYTAELIVSELVGNAVRYGAPPLQLRLIHERMLTCEVSDAATSSPHVKHARTVDETGRGLFIIASLAEQWGTRYRAQGKSVWAELPTKASSTSS